MLLDKLVRCLLPLLCCAALTGNAASVQFSPRVDIPTRFTHLTGLAVADFNGDGKPDIAVTDNYANQVVVYLNDGTGGFSQSLISRPSATGFGGLGYMVAGDVNEDGKQDLVVGPIAGVQYDLVLLGNGDGTFTQGQIIQTTYGFLNAILVDINGDKHLDLVSGANPSLDVELGDGKGNFTQKPLPAGYQPFYFNTGLTVGDFTGDLHPDFVSSAYNTPQFQFYRGVGDGSFLVPTTITSNFFGSSGENLTSADFNGDGKLDLLLGGAQFASVVFGNGDGSFQTTTASFLSIPNGKSSNTSLTAPSVATADLDGNGTMDVVVIDNNSMLLSAFLNDGTGKFPQKSPDLTAALDSGGGLLRLADLNGDGLPDIIVTNYSTQNLSVFLSIIPKTTPTISIQSSAAQALVGSPISITVQLKPSGANVPTGAVSLASGTTSYGQQALNSAGQALFTLSNLPAGQYPITATYAGDKYNNSATSVSAITQAVTDFQVSLSASSQAVAVGANATYAVSLSPVAGFSGSVSLACSGLPSGFACSSTSATLIAQAASVNLVVSPPPKIAGLPQRSLPGTDSTRTLALCCSFGLFLLSRRRKRAQLFVVLATAAILLGSLAGCSNGPSTTPPYTGTSAFSIIATTTQGSVVVSHQTTATLTVQ